MPSFSGILTAMVTPFDAEGRVNEDAAVKLAHHLLKNGSDGLVVCGTTGEAATLTDEEHLALIKLIADEVGGDKVIGGVGSNDTRHAIHLTETAASYGVKGLLSVTPYYNKPNRRGIKAHFAEVARAAGTTPVILYNIPSRTAVDMPNELLAELAQLDNIVAVKQANPDNLAPIDGLEILAGNDADLARTLDMGEPGGILVASHIVGTEMRRMIDEPENRQEIHDRLSDVFETLFLTASPTCTKAALNLLGHDVGGCRLPMVEADEEELEAVRQMLDRHQLLDRAAAR